MSTRDQDNKITQRLPIPRAQPRPEQLRYRHVVVNVEEHKELKDTYYKLDRFTTGLLMGRKRSTWLDNVL